MTAPVGKVVVEKISEFDFEVGDEVLVDILDRGKHYVEGTKAAYLVPPTTRNMSKESRRTGLDSEL
jgi:hypothetical protein